MVTRHSSPSFFFRYQALISLPGPPPTIARSSIEFPLPSRPPAPTGIPGPTRDLPAPGSRPRASADRLDKNRTPFQRFRARIQEFGPPGRTPSEDAHVLLAKALLFLKGR